MADAAMHVKLVPEIDEEALRDRIIEVIAGHAVVKPGETLVIRVTDWTPGQADCYQQVLDAQGLPFRVLVVIGEGLAVAKPEDDEAFSERVIRVLADQARRAPGRPSRRAGNGPPGPYAFSAFRIS